MRDLVVLFGGSSSERKVSVASAQNVASVLEQIGFRQLTAVWRVQGAWAALRKRRHVWGEMTRTGFGGQP